MSKDIECPYCNHEFDLCHDDGAYYSESQNEEAECPECEKKFMVSTSISFNHYAEKAECLNDENHKWEKKYDLRWSPHLSHKERCRYCDKERDLNNL